MTSQSQAVVDNGNGTYTLVTDANTPPPAPAPAAPEAPSVTSDEIQALRDELAALKASQAPAPVEPPAKESEGGEPETPNPLADEVAELRQEQLESAVFEAAKGEDNFQNLVEWAGDNLNSDQIDTFNAAMQSGHKPTAVMAVQFVIDRFNDDWNAKQSTAAAPLHGGAAPGGITISSRAHLGQLTTSKEYQQDAAYRAQVDAATARFLANR